MNDQTYTLRVREGDSEYRETKLTKSQAESLMGGQAIAFYPREKGVRVDPGPTIVRCESAVPETPAA